MRAQSAREQMLKEMLNHPVYHSPKLFREPLYAAINEADLMIKGYKALDDGPLPPMVEHEFQAALRIKDILGKWARRWVQKKGPSMQTYSYNGCWETELDKVWHADA